MKKVGARKIAFVMFTDCPIPTKNLTKHVAQMHQEALKLRAECHVCLKQDFDRSKYNISLQESKRFLNLVLDKTTLHTEHSSLYETLKFFEDQQYTHVYVCESEKNFGKRKTELSFYTKYHTNFINVKTLKLKSLQENILLEHAIDSKKSSMLSKIVSKKLAPQFVTELHETLRVNRDLLNSKSTLLKESRSFKWNWIKKSNQEHVAAFEFFGKPIEVKFRRIDNVPQWEATFQLSQVVSMSEFKKQFVQPVLSTVIDIIVGFIKSEKPNKIQMEYKSSGSSPTDSVVTNFFRVAIASKVKPEYVVTLLPASGRMLFVIRHRALVEQKYFHNSLDYSRHEMPQIKKNNYTEFFKFLYKNGVTTVPKQRNVMELLPSQKELSKDRLSEKIDKLLLNPYDESLNKPFITSKDGRLLDGHHLYGAHLALNPYRNVDVYEAQCDIYKLMELAHSFDKSTVKTLSGQTIAQNSDK